MDSDDLSVMPSLPFLWREGKGMVVLYSDMWKRETNSFLDVRYLRLYKIVLGHVKKVKTFPSFELTLAAFNQSFVEFSGRWK